MPETTRRRLLRSTSLFLLGILSGCVSNDTGSETRFPTGSDERPNGNSSLTAWEPSTHCSEKAVSMYNSVISVEEVREDIDEGVGPIQFEDVPPEEREILRTVTEEGGYGTCNTSEAFGEFVDRVEERRSQQDGATIYSAREGQYYGLYVEVTGQVFSYRVPRNGYPR